MLRIGFLDGTPPSNPFSEIPDSFGLAPESNDHAREVRQLLFKTRRGQTYRALFTIRDQDVIVLRVRGPSQDLLAAEDLIDPDEEVPSNS